MNEIFKHLTEKQKQVYLLHSKGMKQDEIAKELRISQPTVSRILRGATDKVNDYLKIAELAVIVAKTKESA